MTSTPAPIVNLQMPNFMSLTVYPTSLAGGGGAGLGRGLVWHVLYCLLQGTGYMARTGPRAETVPYSCTCFPKG